MQAFFRLRLIFINRFASRCIFDERVGKFGQFFALKRVEFHVKYSGFPFQVFRLIIFGERNVHVFRFTDIHTHHLVFKTGDKLSAAKGQIETLCFAALKFHAVDRADEINVRDIAVLRRTAFHGHFACVTIEQTIDLCVDLFVLNSIRIFLDFNTFISGNFHFGLHGNDRHHANAFVGKIFHRHVGIADYGKFLFILVKNRAVIFREKKIERIFIENAFAVYVFNHALGCFALTEAVDREFAFRFKVRVVLRFLPFFCVKFHGDFDGTFFCRFGSVFHNLSPIFMAIAPYTYYIFLLCPYILSHLSKKIKRFYLQFRKFTL